MCAALLASCRCSSCTLHHMCSGLPAHSTATVAFGIRCPLKTLPCFRQCVCLSPKSAATPSARQPTDRQPTDSTARPFAGLEANAMWSESNQHWQEDISLAHSPHKDCHRPMPAAHHSVGQATGQTIPGEKKACYQYQRCWHPLVAPGSGPAHSLQHSGCRAHC